MNETSQTINERWFSCQSIGQISIWMILVVSKCSIYDGRNPISLIFQADRHVILQPFFRKILQIILFHANKSACQLIWTIAADPTLHSNRKNLSNNSPWDFDTVLDTIDHNWFYPDKNFCPQSTRSRWEELVWVLSVYNTIKVPGGIIAW